MAKGKIVRPQPAFYDGYRGAVSTAADFAKCSPARKLAIMGALSNLMTMYQEGVAKAEARYANAAAAVEREREAIREESEFLSTIMATFVEFSHAVTIGAAEAIKIAADAEPPPLSARAGRGDE